MRRIEDHLLQYAPLALQHSERISGSAETAGRMSDRLRLYIHQSEGVEEGHAQILQEKRKAQAGQKP